MSLARTPYEPPLLIAMSIALPHSFRGHGWRQDTNLRTLLVFRGFHWRTAVSVFQEIAWVEKRVAGSSGWRP
jgi:hypothetical protein